MSTYSYYLHNANTNNNNSSSSNSSLNQILSDKIFQFYYQKVYSSKEYNEFLNLKDKDKVNFLASLFLYINKADTDKFKDSNVFSNFNFLNRNSLHLDLNVDLSEISLKLDLIKNETAKKNFIQKMSKLNMIKNTTYDSKFISTQIEEEEVKSNFREILNKYSNNNPKLFNSANVINTEIQNLFGNIENGFSKNAESGLDHYIRDEESLMQSPSVIKNLSEFKNFNYNSNNNSNFVIPSYATSFYKAEYPKSYHPILDEIKEIDKDLYLIDNREIFIIKSVNEYATFKSVNNSIKENKKDFGTYEYKKLSNPNKRNRVSLLNKRNYNKLNIMSNTATLKFKKSTVPVHDLILVNEPVSQVTIVNNEKLKKKYFLGRDLIDRIYFCPPNNVVVLDYNDTNKLGILLIDYLRIGNEIEIVKNETEVMNIKLEEDSKQFAEEKEKMLNEIEYLREELQSKQGLVVDYINNLRNKIYFSQMMLNKEIGESEDNVGSEKVIAETKQTPLFYTKKKITTVNNNSFKN